MNIFSMKKTIFAECILLTLLIGLLLLLINPFHTNTEVMLSVAVVISLVVLYLLKFFLIFKEKTQDERDLEHRFHSSWASYSVASVILFVGVIVQALQGMVDIWIVAALLAMFASKLISLLYLEVYK